ncbi:MAG: hypothetical protein KatS3mg004_0401 [Bryobacteraceae bacterium]|nr:MAG: hypothetical protein KatS3mg004_0401 [Bryobacteraceae bacterium]
MSSVARREVSLAIILTLAREWHARCSRPDSRNPRSGWMPHAGTISPQLALCRREPPSQLDHARHAAPRRRLHCFAAAAAAADFRATARIDRHGLPSTARGRNAPPDDLHATLNPCSTLPTAKPLAPAKACGLHPHLGFLPHGRLPPSLTLDPVEPLRSAKGSVVCGGIESGGCGARAERRSALAPLSDTGFLQTPGQRSANGRRRQAQWRGSPAAAGRYGTARPFQIGVRRRSEAQNVNSSSVNGTRPRRAGSGRKSGIGVRLSSSRVGQAVGVTQRGRSARHRRGTTGRCANQGADAVCRNGPRSIALGLMAWDLVRSTFDEQRRRQAAPQPCAKRGPKTRYTDDQLTGDIRRTLQASPLHAEG